MVSVDDELGGLGAASKPEALVMMGAKPTCQVGYTRREIKWRGAGELGWSLTLGDKNGLIWDLGELLVFITSSRSPPCT